MHFNAKEADMGSKRKILPRVLVEIKVRYKPTVPDPEQADILASLRDRGYDLVTDAIQAKFFQIKFKKMTLKKARADAIEFCEILLANPVTQNFEITKIEPFERR